MNQVNLIKFFYFKFFFIDSLETEILELRRWKSKTEELIFDMQKSLTEQTDKEYLFFF